MVNLQPDMSRNYPPGSNSANTGPNPSQHNPSANSANRPTHPSNPHSARNIQRSGPGHHHANHHHHHHHQQQLQHGQRPAQPNRPSNPAEQPISDLFDYKVLENTNYPYCPDHSKYENIAKIGQGTFGEVHKAKIRATGQIVALKKVLTENEKEGVGQISHQMILLNLNPNTYFSFQ